MRDVQKAQVTKLEPKQDTKRPKDQQHQENKASESNKEWFDALPEAGDGPVKNEQNQIESSPGEGTQKTLILTPDSTPVKQDIVNPQSEMPASPASPASPGIVITEPGPSEQEKKQDGGDLVSDTAHKPWLEENIEDQPVVMPTPLLHATYQGDSPALNRHREKKVHMINHHTLLSPDVDDILGPADEDYVFRSWRQTASMEHLNVEEYKEGSREPRIKNSASAPDLQVNLDLYRVPSVLEQMQYERPALASKTVSAHITHEVAEYKLDSINFTSDKEASSSQSHHGIHVDVSRNAATTYPVTTLNDNDTRDSEVKGAVAESGPTTGDLGYQQSSNITNSEDTKSEDYEERERSSEDEDFPEPADIELDEPDVKMEDDSDGLNECNHTFSESSSFDKESDEIQQSDNKTPQNEENPAVNDQLQESLNVEQCSLNDIRDKDSFHNEVEENYKEPYSEQAIAGDNDNNLQNFLELESASAPDELNQPNQKDKSDEQCSRPLDNEIEDDKNTEAENESDVKEQCHIPTLNDLKSNDGNVEASTSIYSLGQLMEDSEPVPAPREGRSSFDEMCHIPTLTELAGEDDGIVMEACTSNDILEGRRLSEDDIYENPVDGTETTPRTLHPKPPPGRSGKGCVQAR